MAVQPVHEQRMRDYKAGRVGCPVCGLNAEAKIVGEIELRNWRTVTIAWKCVECGSQWSNEYPLGEVHLLSVVLNAPDMPELLALLLEDWGWRGMRTGKLGLLDVSTKTKREWIAVFLTDQRAARLALTSTFT